MSVSRAWGLGEVCHRSGAMLALALVFSWASTALANHLDDVPTTADLRKPLQNEGYLTFLPNPVDLNQYGEEWNGWIDVRHPAMDGTTSQFDPYERSNRYVNVKTIVATDNTGIAASPNIQRDFDYANKIWMQQGVSVIRTGGGAVTLNGAGGAPTVDWSNAGPGMNLTDQDDALKTLARAGAPTIDVYYIRKFTDANLVGLSSPPGTFRATNNDGISIADAALNDTLAHELGHSILNGDNALHMAGPNLMDPTNHSYTFDQIGPVGGKDLFTDGQIQQTFTPPAGGNPNSNNAGQIQLTAAADDHRYANRVDWDFVTDERRLQTLDSMNVNPDTHAGQDTLYFGIDPAGVGPGADPTHDNAALGSFYNLGDFSGQTFRTADVFGLTTRYSDYDQTDGAFNLKASAEDYSLWFQLQNGDVVAGIPVVAFQYGWTAETNADNYMLRWKSPADAVGIFIEANNGANHDGIAQIDAIIVSPFAVPEPASLALLALGSVLLLTRRRS
jgi:PEP-CTERM motif